MWKKSSVTGAQNERREKQEMQGEVRGKNEGRILPKGTPTEGNRELLKGIDQGARSQGSLATVWRMERRDPDGVWADQLGGTC